MNKTFEQTSAIWNQCKISQDTGCWVFGGIIAANGYGHTKLKTGKKYYSLVHRVMYSNMLGPIPKGHHVHHLCKNRSCCNPAHLESISPSDHKKLEPPVPKKYCNHGHKMTPENTIIVRRRSGSSNRACRTCATPAEKSRCADLTTV